jgi:hypothetical protein
VSVAARARRVPLGAEIALAFLAGAGTFVLMAVVVAGIESDVLIVLLGVPFVHEAEHLTHQIATIRGCAAPG